MKKIITVLSVCVTLLLIASACIARLHADEAFQKQLAKVKEELIGKY